MPSRSRRLLSLLALPAWLALATPAGAQSIHDEVGLTALIQRLGPNNQPTGMGVVVGQVEAPGPGFLPDPSHPEFLGKTFIAMSSGTAISGHATAVAQYMCGLFTSLAPGASTIRNWDASHWLGNGFLMGTGLTPPQLASFKVLNNSWIGSSFDSQMSLRKFDAMIERDQVLVSSGVNNGTGPLDVPLLSHAFNGIAVGRSDGQHHAGGTAPGIDGPGRMKPELVAPAGATSFSTPLVAGAGLLLVETARTHPVLSLDPAAERADLLKAVLMSGAKHRPGWDNGAQTSGPLRGETQQPLDVLFGADQIEVNRSHWILTGGRSAGQPGPLQALHAPMSGWDVVDPGSGETRYWRFQVDTLSPFVSVLATWNRRLAPNFSSWTLPNLELELYGVDPQTGLPVSLLGNAGLAVFAAGNVRSISPVDNVEHLYVLDLQPGTYLLELRRAPDALGSWTAAVAWDFHCPASVAYGSSKITSLGTSPVLRTRGFASVAVNELALQVVDAVPGSVGAAFFGTAPAANPFLGGTLYVAPPIQRLAPVTLDAAGAAEIALPLDPAMVGALHYFQFWFRDPLHPDQTATGLTHGLSVTFCN